jgi:signal transduction histidine kinase
MSEPRLLDEVVRGCRGVLGRGRAVTDVLAQASSRTADLADSFRHESRYGHLVEIFLADVLVGLAFERDWSDSELQALLAVGAHTSGDTRDGIAMGVFLQAANDPRLLQLPPRVALEAKLRFLLLLPPVTEASLWVWQPNEPFAPLVHLGASAPTQSIRAAARGAIFGGIVSAKHPRGLIHAVPVMRLQEPAAALVVRARKGQVRAALVLAREAARSVSAVLERELLLHQSTETEQLLNGAGERRLARLGLDLHDGPLQGIALLHGDLQHFRGQIAKAIESDHRQAPLVGRVDDLIARLKAVDSGLREMAGSFEDPEFAKRPLADAIKSELASLAAHAGIEVSLEIDGTLDDLTASQRIAIYRIIQEALANAREHGQASDIKVTVSRRRHSIYAEVVDNGIGMDVERSVFAAAKRGRLGLIGMSERARLLGGTLGVESKPGGPTRVALTLPEWKP